MGRFLSVLQNMTGRRQEEDDLQPPSALLKSFFIRFDYFQIVPMILLLCVGLLFIYGTGQQIGGVYAGIWKRQLLYMGIGFFCWGVCIFIDYRWFAPGTILFYPLAILLLVLVLFVGTEQFGARRWLSIAGFSVQPSEFGKLAVLLAVSRLLSLSKADINKPLWMAIVAVVTLIPFCLIYKEPDLGTALVLLPMVGAIILAARLKWIWLLIFLIVAAAALPTVYYNLKPYQKERIQTFLNPDSDPQNRGWNAIQAELAVGRGGMTGTGFMKGTRCSLGYLPTTVANSDFIFPVIAEETGFIGTLALLLLYAILLFSILRTALLAPDDFGRFLCVGVAVLLATHVFVNIGMSIKLLPITGLPLPLVSYGGSFLVAMMIYLGIVQSVYAHRKQESFFAV